jgi:hypothetical protein
LQSRTFPVFTKIGRGMLGTLKTSATLLTTGALHGIRSQGSIRGFTFLACRFW